MNENKKETRAFIVGFVLILCVMLWAVGRSWYGGQLVREEEKNEAEGISKEILSAKQITIEKLREKIDANAKIRIFDSRPDSDFRKAHIIKTENIPDSINLSLSIAKLETNKAMEIIIIGKQADTQILAKCVNELNQNGYQNAEYLSGGMEAWEIKAYPTVSSEIKAINIKVMSATELKEQLEYFPDSIIILDIRATSQFEQNSIQGATNIPLAEIEERHNELPAAKKIVIYGSNEEEEKTASTILLDLNYFNVFRLEGGLEAWEKVNRPNN